MTTNQFLKILESMDPTLAGPCLFRLPLPMYRLVRGLLKTAAQPLPGVPQFASPVDVLRLLDTRDFFNALVYNPGDQAGFKFSLRPLAALPAIRLMLKHAYPVV